MFSEIRAKTLPHIRKISGVHRILIHFDVDKTSRKTFTQGFLKYDTQAQLKNRHIIYVKFQRFYQRLIVAI